MTVAEIISQIRSVRAQLDVIEANLRTLLQPKPHSFADLKGMLRGQSHSTEEEIETALYPNPRPEEW